MWRHMKKTAEAKTRKSMLLTKMNSLYQISSKMLHGTKAIISMGKKNRNRGDLAGIQTLDLHIRS